MAGGPIRLPIVSRFDDRGVKDASAALTGFAKNSAIALGAVTAAVGAFGIASVRAFADFDAAMNESLAIMGNVSDALRDDMAQAARDVAKSTTFSAEEAAEAFYFLASAGLSAEQSIGAMPKVAAFAQAGMFDLATATSLLADAQSAMGLTSSDATENMENLVRVSDVLVKANILANASVQQFSEALTNKAAASMKALNIPLEEGVAVLATFAAQGIKGSEAGTTFNATIRGLTNGVLRFGDRFKAMNIEVYDAQGNFNNMADIVGQMEEAIGDLSVEQQRAALTQLGFTEETLAGTLALLGNSEAIRSYEESLREAGGTTEDVAGKQLETFNAQLSLMKSGFDDVMLSVGAGLTPTLMEFAENLGPILDQLGPALILLFQELGPVITSIAEELPGFIEALLPMIPIIGDLALLTLSVAEAIMPILSGVIQEIGPILEGFTGALGENGEMFGALIVAGALFVGVLRIISAWFAITGGAGAASAAAQKPFLAVLFSMVGLIASAIAALGGLAYYLFHVGQTTEELNPVFRGFLEGLAGLVYGTAYIIQTITTTAISQMNGLLNAATKGIEAAYNTVARAFKRETITLAAPVIPLPKMTTLEDLRREMGLLRDETFTFTPKRVDGGPGSFLSTRSEDRRFAMLGGGGGPQGITGGVPMNPAALAAAFLNTGMGQTTLPLLGSQTPADQRNYNITVNAGMGTDPTQLGDEIYNILLQYDRYAAPVFASARQ
jgi:TP901 family phage tail tape measure protein